VFVGADLAGHGGCNLIDSPLPIAPSVLGNDGYGIGDPADAGAWLAISTKPEASVHLGRK